MYSVVLMMAMTTQPDAAAFGKHGGCHGGRGGKLGKHRGHGGCCGCCGGGYGGGCYGGGCYGGCMGYGGCTGYGGGCWGGGYMIAPSTAPAGPPPTGPAPKPAGGTMLSAPATIVVSLPADATLKVDGAPTKATSDLRAFATPVLPIGQVYHYTLTAAIVRDGQPMTATQQVTVRGGETSRVEIPANVFGRSVAMK
ncbi:MAG TPA: TIGR03000 domain-containing protein [Gemmataceae bacterium]|jgi:uncharacterized protein (TIGR03000 family)|nr:TIGR03000 domain-containing protein [Gemmataceae bacterium]